MLCNTRATTGTDERRTAKQPRSGRGKPWAAKQQAARLIWQENLYEHVQHQILHTPRTIPCVYAGPWPVSHSAKTLELHD